MNRVSSLAHSHSILDPLAVALLIGEGPTFTIWASTITLSSIKGDSLCNFVLSVYILAGHIKLLFQKIIYACTQFFIYFLICSNLNTYLHGCQLSFNCPSVVIKRQSLLEQARDRSCSPISGVDGQKDWS